MVQLMCPKDFVPTGTPKTNRKICNMKEKVRVDGMDAVMTNLNKIWINAYYGRFITWAFTIIQLILLALILWRVW